MFYSGKHMNLDQVGIFLKCLCGAQLTADIIGVLFEDRGQVKIGENSLRCQECGAVYRKGERLNYRLGRVERQYHSIT